GREDCFGWRKLLLPARCQAPTTASKTSGDSSAPTNTATSAPAAPAAPTQKIVVVPAKTAAPPPSCARSGNNGTNPDTGGALKADFQYVSTDASGTVVAVSFTTPTNYPFGGNRWSNNGAWGNVMVGGKIVSEGGNYYYPPGCQAPTTASKTSGDSVATTNTGTSAPAAPAAPTQKIGILPGTTTPSVPRSLVTTAAAPAVFPTSALPRLQTVVATPQPPTIPDTTASKLSDTQDGGVSERPKRRLPPGYQQAV
ncbi:hypothetical protein EMGBS3_09570, partial [Anaerolineaceae bacterium]